MPLEVIESTPKFEDFTPLSEHQEETPNTFFGAQPVLHFHTPNAKVHVRRTEYEQNDILKQIPASVVRTQLEEGIAEPDDVAFEADVWVTSQHVLLSSRRASKRVKIDYPTISLHALGTHSSCLAAVILQLDLHDASLTNDDDDIRTLTLDIVPLNEPIGESLAPSADGAPTDRAIHPSTNGHTNGNSAPSNSPQAKAMFEALSTCADLHPDPMDEEDDGEGEEMPEPGAGGWITSENVHGFVDAEGNWIGPTLPVLGAGAGHVRPREEGEEEEEGKWQRTG